MSFAVFPIILRSNQFRRLMTVTKFKFASTIQPDSSRRFVQWREIHLLWFFLLFQRFWYMNFIEFCHVWDDQQWLVYFAGGSTAQPTALCVAETFVPNAPALFAYAERAAVLGGAQLLVVLESEDFPARNWRHSNLSSSNVTNGGFFKRADPHFSVGFNTRMAFHDWMITGATPMA